MDRPQSTLTRHHIFNLQRLSSLLSPLINSTFAVKDTTFSGTAMLYSGCSICIVPISQLPKEARKRITHSGIHMKGSNGRIPDFGELNCDIIIGSHNSPVFKEIDVLVTAQATPILIGQNILGHDTLDTYSINNCNPTVEFRRMLTSGHTIHTTSILPAFFAYPYTSIIPIERNCNLQSIAVEQLKDDTDSKIIRALQPVDSSGIHIDPEDHRETQAPIFSGARHLRSNDKRQ